MRSAHTRPASGPLWLYTVAARKGAGKAGGRERSGDGLWVVRLRGQNNGFCVGGFRRKRRRCIRETAEIKLGRPPPEERVSGGSWFSERLTVRMWFFPVDITLPARRRLCLTMELMK